MQAIRMNDSGLSSPRIALYHIQKVPIGGTPKPNMTVKTETTCPFGKDRLMAQITRQIAHKQIKARSEFFIYVVLSCSREFRLRRRMPEPSFSSA
jgi:hypothetical protein